MAVTLAQLLSERATAKIPFGKETLTVTFDPGFYSLAREAQLNALARGESPNDSTGGLIAVKRFLLLVKEWDLEDGKGKVVPLTEEGLAPIPTKTLNELYVKVITDAPPGKEA